MDLDKNPTGNLKGLRKMYANAKPVINPEHQYDRQGTFLRIKDLLEERARALNHVPEKRGGLPETFEDKYIYPHMDNISPQYPKNFGLDLISNSRFSHITQSRLRQQGAIIKYENKFVTPVKKYAPPVGPDRKVFRGQKQHIPYSAYSSSYGTYPNHAILSVGNADHGVPRWEIRAVPRDGPIHDPQLKRKVTIDENAQIKNGILGKANPKPMTLETQRALKSILKKGPTTPIDQRETEKPPKDIDFHIPGQVSSEEILMLAKETALKRRAIKALKERIPTVEKKTLKSQNADVVTWLKPAFLNYATSEMVAMPDAVMEKLKRTFISSSASDGTSASNYSLIDDSY